MQKADERFSYACTELHRIADINRAAVTSTLEAFDHSSLEERHYAPQSIAMGIRQVMELNNVLKILAIDYEMEAARKKMSTIVSPKQPAGQLDLFA